MSYADTVLCCSRCKIHRYVTAPTNAADTVNHRTASTSTDPTVNQTVGEKYINFKFIWLPYAVSFNFTDFLHCIVLIHEEVDIVKKLLRGTSGDG
jgi:hypothetical protein